MEKIISITIGKVIFNIEEEAYDKLSGYLEEIRKHFSKEKNGEEIIEDIEISIADKFLDRKQGKDSAVTINDVEKIIAQMGTVKDFDKSTEEEEGEKAKEKTESFRNKKLYRDPNDKIIAGVASGLSAYFGIDTSLMRLAFVVTVFFGGIGIIAYVLLWVIIPKASTTAQKLEMHGDRITLKEIENSLKNGIKKIKKKDFSQVEEKLNRIFRAFGKVIWTFFHIIRVVLGIAISLAGLAGIFATSFALSFLISGADIPYLNVQLYDFVTLSGSMHWVFLIALYLLIAIPFIIFMLGGISILKKQSLLKPFGWITLLILWFIALGITSSIAFQNFDQIQSKVEQIHQAIESKNGEYYHWHSSMYWTYTTA